MWATDRGVSPGSIDDASIAVSTEQRLPDSLRRAMQERLGADFSGVRIVHSTVAATLGARALAGGRAVFFAPNAYDPDGGVGRRLIAHELAHLVQQWSGRVQAPATGQIRLVRDAALEAEADLVDDAFRARGALVTPPREARGLVLQPSIGFEFGTNIRVCKEVRSGTFSKTVRELTVPKETELFGGRNSARGWSLETDGGEVELVIDPPIAEDKKGEAKLGRIFGDIAHYFGKLERARQKGNKRLVAPNREFFNPNAEHGLAMTLPDQAIAAQPQVTVGIRLGRVRMLFKEMARLGANSPFALNAQQTWYPKQADTAAEKAVGAGDVAGHAPSEHLRGMITMLAQYLLQGASTGTRAYVKYMTYAMARTDFVGMFKRLRTREKAHFREDPQRWADYVLKATGLENKGHEPLINFKITDGEVNADAIADPQLRSLTREVWLRRMAEGRNAVDLLTKAGSGDVDPYLDVKGGHRLRALGLLGARTDPVGPDGRFHGVVLEFRTLRHGVPWTQWHYMAHQFMTYITKLNETSKQDLAAKPAQLGWEPK